MDFQMTDSDGRTVLRIDGELSISAVAEVREQMISAMDRTGGLELDLRAASDFDTAAVQLIACAVGAAERSGRGMAISVSSTELQDAAERIGVDMTEYLINGEERTDG